MVDDGIFTAYLRHEAQPNEFCFYVHHALKLIAKRTTYVALLRVQ